MSRTNASVAEHVLFVKGPPRRHAEKPWRSLGCSPPQPVPTGPARGVPGPKWLRAVQAHPATASLRVDAHRNVLAVAWALAVDARPDGTSMPTWAALVEQTGLGRRTVARWLAFLVAHGLLHVRETGSTPATRPAWHPVQGNRAALYVLIGLHVDGSGTPPVTNFVSNPYARETVAERPAASGGGAVEPRVWPRMRVTATKADRLRASMQLRADVPAIRGMSAKAIRAATGPQMRAGWTLADVVYALDHEPDGKPHWREAAVRNPHGWLRHRLGLWAGHPSRSSMLTQLAAKSTEQANQRKAEHAAAAAAAVPAGVSAAYTEARAALARLPRRRAA